MSRLSSAQRFPCVLALSAIAALRYYDGSDSCCPSPRAAGLPAYLVTPFRHCASSHVMCSGIALHAISSAPGKFRTSPSSCRLVVTHRRIEFALLRTASSPPVALHPASQRRSYLRLQGLGLPWHGLSPCWCRAFTGALPRRDRGSIQRTFRHQTLVLACIKLNHYDWI